MDKELKTAAINSKIAGSYKKKVSLVKLSCKPIFGSLDYTTVIVIQETKNRVKKRPLFRYRKIIDSLKTQKLLMAEN